MNGRAVHERTHWNTCASADAIRHFALGIGDDNPLWMDPAYAARGRYGRPVAPPAFLASVVYPFLHGAPLRFPITNLASTVGFEWFYPIVEGDRLHGETRQTDVREGRNRRGHRLAYILAETRYMNHRNEIVAVVEATTAMILRPEEEALASREIYRYTPQELDCIADAIEQEQRRGDIPLFREDVPVGTSFGMVVGPLTIGDLVWWQAATGPNYLPTTLGYHDSRKRPHNFCKHPVTGWAINRTQQHVDGMLASQRGMPLPFDYTLMRAGYVCRMLTDWMGDQGTLKRLNLDTPEPGLYGDTVWYEGCVEETLDTSMGVLTTVRISGTNQLGKVLTTGHAEILLPSRACPHSVANQAAESTQANARIVDLIEARALSKPDTAAVTCGGERLSRGELRTRSNRLAHVLVGQGVGAGGIVGLCIGRSIDYVVAVLAVIKAGGAFMPLDPSHPIRRLNRAMSEAGVQWLVKDGDAPPSLDLSLAKQIDISGYDAVLGATCDDPPVSVATREDPAYVIYTSGTTGKPKGVLIPRAALDDYIPALQQVLDVDETDVALHTASFTFSASVRQLFLPLCSGANLVIAGDVERLDPRAFLDICERHRATLWDTVPSVLHYMVEALSEEKHTTDRMRTLALRRVQITGEPLAHELVLATRRLLGRHVPIVNLYSQTETAGTICVYTVPDDPENETDIVPIGHPIGRAEIYLLDTRLQPVAAGGVGDIYIGGTRLARAYVGDPKLSGESFIPDPFVRDATARIYRTGDLGRYGPTGLLEHVGRSDRQTKVRGMRIPTVEIEDVLLEQPAVSQAAIVRHRAGVLIAYIVFGNADDHVATPNSHELRALLEEEFPQYMIPSVFTILPDLPTTPEGNIDFKALSTHELEGSDDGADPRGDVEQTIASIWKNILELEHVARDWEFYEIGGDSISFTRILNRLRISFRCELLMPDMFAATTIAAQAELIQSYVSHSDE